jgi:hypothetical protein
MRMCVVSRGRSFPLSLVIGTICIVEGSERNNGRTASFYCEPGKANASVP